MNKRLKELMLDAGYAAPEIAQRAQKLAELIVQECLDTIADERFELPDFIIDKVKQHFAQQPEE
jgi:hypothetical protein